MGCLKSILEYADELHLLRGLPRFERAGLNQKEKGILTNEEVNKLFSLKWEDNIAYAASLISASTGFRLGEVLGLKLKNIHKGRLEITGSWDGRERKYKYGTKNGQSSRSVPIPESVEKVITELVENNNFGDDPELYLLYTYHTPFKPVQDRRVVKGFFKALENIGIDEKRKET